MIVVVRFLSLKCQSTSFVNKRHVRFIVSPMLAYTRSSSVTGGAEDEDEGDENQENRGEQ